MMSQGGALTQKWGAATYYLAIFLENWMKMKKIGPERAYVQYFTM